MQQLTRPRTRPNVFDRRARPILPVLTTAVLAVILALVSPGSAAPRTLRGQHRIG